jgi:hypothetical protein
MRRSEPALIALAASFAVVLSPPAVHAQRFTDPSPSAFRVTWERRAYGVMPAVEGRVENDSTFRVTAVRLRVEGLDDGGQAVGETSTWVFGSIPAHGQGYFVVPVIPGAKTYRISVSGFDRVIREETVESP